MTYTPWDPRTATPEAKAAWQQWFDARLEAGLPVNDPHDPEMLLCLDKHDIVDRYQILLQSIRGREREMRTVHEFEVRQLKERAAAAVEWWRHCAELRRQKRKTAHLADMPVTTGGRS